MQAGYDRQVERYKEMASENIGGKKEREKGEKEAITTVKCTSDLIILHIKQRQALEDWCNIR